MPELPEPEPLSVVRHSLTVKHSTPGFSTHRRHTMHYTPQPTHTTLPGDIRILSLFHSVYGIMLKQAMLF